MTVRRVGVIAQEPLPPFELGVIHEVFGVDRTQDGVPRFELVIAAASPGHHFKMGGGASLTAEHCLDALAEVDLVAVPSGPEPAGAHQHVLSALRRAPAAGAVILGTCTGVFTMAEAGLLAGREVAVHWRYKAALGRAYPNVHVDHEALYVADDRVVTSAGTSAGIDACLHLVRESHGPGVANRIARRMVSPPHRPGGQLQFVEHPVPESSDDAVQVALQWIEQNLAADITLSCLAAQAHVSPRTLTRRFHDAIGQAPLAWVTTRRVAHAQELLSETDLPVEAVARAVGWSTAARLRHNFRIVTGTTPRAYRSRFRPEPQDKYRSARD